MTITTKVQLLPTTAKVLTVSIINKGCSDGGARGVVVIVVGNGHGDKSSNPGRDWLHFT